MKVSSLVPLCAALLCACPDPVVNPPDGGGGGAGGGTGGGGGADVTCQTCTSSADCGGLGACVQIGGTDVCGTYCTLGRPCAPGQVCAIEVAAEGTQVNVCVPLSGGCGSGPSCPPVCPPGSECDSVTAECVPVFDGGGGGAGGGTGGGTGGGGGDGGTDGGPTDVCGVYDGPTRASCCSSCAVDAGNCQSNGCYGGWWCDRTICRCHTPPTSCGGGAGGGAGGGTGGGTGGGGGTTSDAGIGPNGGAVPRLYFAVVGDTRPALNNDTANYPTAIITGIYQSIAALNPRPQFVVATGDYMFASPGLVTPQDQMRLYMGARANYPNQVFGVLGNHECTGATLTNCADAQSGNIPVFMNALIQPLGRTQPYYSLNVTSSQGTPWTAKFLFVACNMWDATQAAWLQGELNRPTTHTFIVRHMNFGVSAPCTTQLDTMVRASTYTMALVGHTHTYSHSGKTLVEGVGGAPITGSASYGYATIEQLSPSGFRVTQYDYTTGRAVDTYTLP